MSVITKDLGAVSAYGLALEAGFEGTEQEYAELLASYGTVAQEAADSASRAAQAANATGQLYGQTALARDAAISAKEDAESAQATAAQAANVAGRYASEAESAKTAAESAKDTAVNAVDGFAAGAQQALDSVNEAGGNWKSLAERQAGNSEAWAVGQRGGVDVPTTDATYHNNAKYYVEQASGEKTAAQTARQGAETAATNASQSATAAATSASQAAESARTLTIDSTLTHEGQAAGAKETGDEITGLKEEFNGVSEVLSLKDSVELSYTKENDGNYIRFSTGVLTPSTPFCTTNYINLAGLSKITYSQVKSTAASTTVGMAFYNANKEYVSGIRALFNQSEAGYEDSTVEIPSNAVYARFSMYMNEDTYGVFAISGKSMLKGAFDVQNERIGNLEEKIESRTDENDLILSFNNNVSLDAPITTTGKYIKFSDGTEVQSSPYGATDYIDVSKYAYIHYKRLKMEMPSPTHGMAFYDANKTYISGERAMNNQSTYGYVEGEVFVPENAVYARFTTWLNTEPYGEFTASGKSKLLDATEPAYKSAYQKDVIFGNYSSDWYKGQGESYTGFTINTLYVEMITAWDVLVADSKGYITKEEIGTASDGQIMYCYKLIPARYRNNTGSSVINNPPTFLIIPSIHGYEKSAAYGTYYFARDLVYSFDKNPVLNSIRTKCVIYIVPVGNPWGFDNKQRKNANGVDLNRNWGVDPTGEDDPSSQYYPGAEPFDQPETQAIKGLIDNNTNIFYVVDYHTNGQYKVASWANVNWMTYGYASVYNDDYSRLSYVASQFQISDISENLPIEYSLNTNGESIGNITIGAKNAPRPTITYYTRNELNIMGATFEGNNGLPSETDAYSDIEQKINSELIGNWIKNLLLVYKDASLK